MAKKKMSMKSMAMGDEKCTGCQVCGMHLCKDCQPPNILFGLLFILTGIGSLAGIAPWLNGWVILGLYLLLWGLIDMTKAKK